MKVRRARIYVAGEADMGSLRMGFGTLDYPAGTFTHPAEVVRDPGLTLNEKRAILASWASDACAVEAAPALRRIPDGRLVTIDDVMDALRRLDREAGQIHEAPSYGSVLENRIPDLSRRTSGAASHAAMAHRSI
jgi:hypothetical protein